jgi:hypothetical protein
MLDPKFRFAIAVPTAAGRSEDIRNLDLFSPDVDLASLDLVIAPLIGTGFDAIEMILLLGKAGFRGRLLVRSGLLPDIHLVIGELREAAEPFGFSVELAETQERAG